MVHPNDINYEGIERKIVRKELPKCLTYETYRVYLPTKLDLVKFIKKHPLPELNNMKSPQKQLDNVRYVLGFVYDVFSNNKGLNSIENLGFTNLCIEYVRKVVIDAKKILDGCFWGSRK